VLVACNLLEVFRQLRDAGKCLIFSYHILSEVERLCDRTAIMHHGRILDSGTLPELFERHQKSDFEELFFDLLSRHEADESLPASTATPTLNSPPIEAIA
ncbi:MAG: ABC transporter ATP-binding protein, partial [Planctomycetota bacterium]